jgi:hypothetical protein
MKTKIGIITSLRALFHTDIQKSIAGIDQGPSGARHPRPPTFVNPTASGQALMGQGGLEKR